MRGFAHDRSSFGIVLFFYITPRLFLNRMVPKRYTHLPMHGAHGCATITEKRAHSTSLPFSQSGWTNEEVMVACLKQLREYVARPCALIVDTYAAHRTQNVREMARKLEIELVFSPSGCTDLCQPLD